MTDELITNSFRTPLGWRSGHLQTIRNRVIRRTFDLDRGGTTRSVLVDLNDGTGDQLAVQLHRSRRDPIAGSDEDLWSSFMGSAGRRSRRTFAQARSDCCAPVSMSPGSICAVRVCQVRRAACCITLAVPRTFAPSSPVWLPSPRRGRTRPTLRVWR